MNDLQRESEDWGCPGYRPGGMKGVRELSDPHIIELARQALKDREAEAHNSKGSLLEMIRHLVVHLNYLEEELTASKESEENHR